MKLIYINNSRSSVLDSQVLSLLRYYIKTNVFDKVILFFGYRNQADKDWLEAKKIDGIRICYYKTFPNYPFFNKKIRNNIFKSVKSIDKQFENYFFHIRGEMTSFHLKSIRKTLNIPQSNILTDVRGASYEEIKEFMDINPILKRLKIHNVRKANLNLMKDDNISVVSHALKGYLIDKWRIPAAKITVNSCLVSHNFTYSYKKRSSVRQQLNLTDEDILIIFSSGGTAKWQENSVILDIANKGFKVLNLSKIKVAHRNIVNKFVPYSHVPAYLSAADAAFIWRSDSIVNKVSSPVKFSEYMAVGLPVIHNGTVDLINETTEMCKNGIRINSMDKLKVEMIKSYLNNYNREQVCFLGQKIFGLDNITQGYKEIYTRDNE